MQILNFPFPLADDVGGGDVESICLLLQLILGAAVNCERKNDFIAGLMQLDEVDQAELMNLIQIILDSSVSTDAQFNNGIHDEEQLKQRLHELEKVHTLMLLTLQSVITNDSSFEGIVAGSGGKSGFEK